MFNKNKKSEMDDLNEVLFNTTEVVWSPDNYSVPTTVVKKKSLKHSIFRRLFIHADGKNNKNKDEE